MLFEGLKHVHLKVSDIDRSKAFYTEGFGLKVAASAFGGQLVTLTTPGAGDSLVLSEGVPAGMLDFAGDSVAGDSAGVDHIGFVLKDPAELDQAIELLVSLGGTLVCTLRPNKESAFLRDPDGYVIQI
jgi:catechol 2,3-dioxygenase-like lactoylglutathione lyase family enzyme